MSDSPSNESVQAQMQQLRYDIDGGMQDMAANARRVVDWKHYVSTYPWVCLGAAAALGFLIVPKRSRTNCPDSAVLTEPARPGHGGGGPAAAPTHGWIDALLAGVANVAVRKAAEYLSQSAGRLLGLTDQPGANNHDSHSTS